MIRFDMATAAQQLGCEFRGHTNTFHGVAIDTRKLRSGELFVALAGQNVDGHQYVDSAQSQGAAGALVARWQSGDLPQILCSEPVTALGQLAGAWRAQCNAKVLGITGSNGKTTVKGMLVSIASDHRACLATRGNYNNEIGLPLTLCRLNPEHRLAIVEMGASKPGDITYLSNIARPQTGLITNAAAAHLQGMLTTEGVARAKGELILGLPADGVAILNADDPYLELWRAFAGARVVRTFGMQNPADVSGRYRAQASGSMLELATPLGKISLHLRTRGWHNASNAVAAATAAWVLGLDLSQIQAGLEAFEPVAGRLTARRMPSGWLLIEDSYNANPASLQAGLTTLAEQQGEHWLVLGDMAELGPDSAALHYQCGEVARRLGVQRVFCTGEMSRHTVSGFGNGAEFFVDPNQLVERFRAAVHTDVICLVKGSRSMHMEAVAEAMAGGG